MGDLDVADVERRLVDIVDVEEGVATQADVDEAGSHSREHVHDFALVDRADDFFFTFEVNLGELSVLPDGDPVLPGVARDEDLCWHFRGLSVLSFQPAHFRSERRATIAAVAMAHGTKGAMSPDKLRCERGGGPTLAGGGALAKI